MSMLLLSLYFGLCFAAVYVSGNYSPNGKWSLALLLTRCKIIKGAMSQLVNGGVLIFRAHTFFQKSKMLYCCL